MSRMLCVLVGVSLVAGAANARAVDSVALTKGQAAEPVRLSEDQMDAITAGLIYSSVESGALAVGSDYAYTNAGGQTTATATKPVQMSTGTGGALASSDTSAVAGASSTSGTESAAVSITTSASGIDDATAGAYSTTKSIDTPGADVAVGHGQAFASGSDTTTAIELAGQGDIVAGGGAATGKTAAGAVVSVDVPSK